MPSEPEDPTCPTDYAWDSGRKCCEFDLTADTQACPVATALTNNSGKCTNDPYDDAGSQTGWEGHNLGYLVTPGFNDPPASLAFGEFMLIRGGDTTSPVKADGTYYNVPGGGGTVSFNALEVACRLAHSAGADDTAKISDLSIFWNGCHCYDVSAPTVDLGEPLFRDFTWLVQLPGEMTATEHAAEMPEPYFGLRLISDPVFGRNCWRENLLWTCPSNFEYVPDAGEDTEYKEGPVGDCGPQCNGVGTCPPGYTYDPDLGLCIPDLTGGGCDLAEFRMGWLLRAYCLTDTVYVGASLDAGSTWADVEVGAGESGISAPALTIDRFDTLWCAWHTRDGLGGTTFLYRSFDLGATWEEVYTVEGRTFPRPLSTPERFLLCTHVSGLEFFSIEQSLDGTGAAPYSATLHEVWTGDQERRADFRQDRRGLLHLVTETTTGEVQHRWSGDLGDTWSDPETFSSDGTGAEVAYNIGVERGFFTHFDGDVLIVGLTDETFSEFLETVPHALPDYPPQQLGTLWDRRGLPWVFGLLDDAPVVADQQDVLDVE